MARCIRGGVSYKRHQFEGSSLRICKACGEQEKPKAIKGGSN